MLPLSKHALLDIPDQFETERLLIRAIRPGDGAIMHASMLESFAELHPWMRWAKTRQTPDEVEGVARMLASKFILREELSYIAFRQTDGAHIGNIGVHHIEWDIPQFEIGYWARTPMTGQGYITEAVNHLTAFLFETLNARRIEIRCDDRNTPSAAVAERAGYTLEAILHNNARDNDGKLVNSRLYVQTRPDSSA